MDNYFIKYDDFVTGKVKTVEPIDTVKEVLFDAEGLNEVNFNEIYFKNIDFSIYRDETECNNLIVFKDGTMGYFILDWISNVYIYNVKNNILGKDPVFNQLYILLGNEEIAIVDVANKTVEYPEPII